MKKKQRLDELLVERGFFASPDEAARAVYAREVRVDDVYATSPATLVSPEASIFVKGRKRFVSRGGDKLQGALEAFCVDVSGKRCVDVGSSTGGFTHCLLQAGAASVACVDVNYGQLAWEVRTDPRVTVFERTNIRTADPSKLGAPFDIIVIDVSFIGLASLAPVLATLAAPDTILLALVKPQFESAHDETEGGIVRDPHVRERVVGEVCQALQEEGFVVEGTCESPITGHKGNVEHLIHALFRPGKVSSGSPCQVGRERSVDGSHCHQ